MIFVPYCLLPVYVQDVGIRIHSIYLPSFVDNVTWQLTSGVNYEITIQTHNIGILYCLKIFMQNITFWYSTTVQIIITFFTLNFIIT